MDTQALNKLADDLAEQQLWRRGIGKYAWSENPEENIPSPFSPKEVGEMIDTVIGIVRNLANEKPIFSNTIAKDGMSVTITPLTDWKLVADCARVTVWKDGVTKDPSDKFKHDICRSEHSPLRALMFRVDLRNIPSFVSVHLVRHFTGVTHFVSSNRPDRNGGNTEITRLSPVNHTMIINAAEIIFISRRRLCGLASPETRDIWSMVISALQQIDPILAQYCVPNCVYLGRCPEPFGCGYNKTESYKRNIESYLSAQNERKA